jgi:hypothetical protein
MNKNRKPQFLRRKKSTNSQATSSKTFPPKPSKNKFNHHMRPKSLRTNPSTSPPNHPNNPHLCTNKTNKTKSSAPISVTTVFWTKATLALDLPRTPNLSRPEKEKPINKPSWTTISRKEWNK